MASLAPPRPDPEDGAGASPYYGPRPVPPGGRLFGRDREVADLADILIAERIVLLYSPSGAGKTSLIQAALVPRLRDEEKFDVLPVMRVRLKPPPDRRLPADFNRYVLSLLLCLDEGLPPEERRPVEELAGMTLAHYLEARSRDREVTGRVLVFDQFEDILTLDPMDRPVKEEFFSQVGAVLRDRRWWALFSMREEFRAGLDPYLRLIPTRLSATYRLDLLEAREALAAIREPAEQAGVAFPEPLAARLVEDLRTVRVPDERKGHYVEPVHLQLVCLRIWQRLPPGAREIREEDLQGVAGVDQALAGHYDDHVRAAAEAAGGTPALQLRRERSLREWFGSKLIKERVRDQVLRPQGDGVDDRSLQVLVNAYLIREDERRGMTWYELTHDRLIDPVLRSNAAWFESHLSPLERQAALWKSRNQAAGFMLGGEALEEAERWAEGNEGMSGDEQKFLEECRKARDLARKERRTARLLRLLSIGAAVCAVLALVFAVQTWQTKRDLQALSEKMRQTLASEVDDNTVEESQSLDQNLRGDLSSEEGRQSLEKALTQIQVASEAGKRLDDIPLALNPAQPIRVKYFAKARDRSQVKRALESLGYQVDFGESTRNAQPTNAVWFGREVPLPEVQRVGLVLIRAGIQIQGIQPFRTRTADNASMIQIGGNAALKVLPPITPDQVETLSVEGIPPRRGGAAAMLPSLSDVSSGASAPAATEPVAAEPEAAAPEPTAPATVPEAVSITIQCFAPEASAGVIRDALEPLGLGLGFRPTKMQTTNAVWFGTEVPLEEVRRVALALIEAGIPIQAVQPFRRPSAANARLIQVGGNMTLVDRPALTAAEIGGLGQEGIPRRLQR